MVKDEVKIERIDSLKDNYIWVVSVNCQAVVIDPGSSVGVKDYISQNSLELKYILITHKHKDHTGGLEVLVQAFPDCLVIGSGKEEIPLVNRMVHGGEVLSLLNMDWYVTHTPGHTLGHVTYHYFDEHNVCHLFSGDNIFVAGCGRMFEGDAKQYYETLSSLYSLPGSTLIYGAHKYTESNIRFALTIDPANVYLLELAKKFEEEGELGTIPTTVDQELSYNPFFRIGASDIINRVKAISNKPISEPFEVFRELRKIKDEFN